MSSSNQANTIVDTLLKNAAGWASDAERFGPFFFGVFLVVVAVVLILLNKNKILSSVFAASGILFMVFSSLIYSGVTSPIHAYKMRLGNLASNHELALTDSSPRIYRHNFVLDTSLDAYQVDLIAISPSKLQKDHPIQVVIVETLQASGRKHKHRLTLPFKGTPDSTYELAPLKSQGEQEEEEEVIGSYRIVQHEEVPFFGGLFARLTHSVITVASAQGIRTLENTSPVREIADVVTPEVIYFDRAADNGKVASALDSAEIAHGLEHSTSNKPSNSVWVGTDVPVDLAKRIGIALLSKGIDIRYFGYFTYRESKTNVVQIGYSKLNSSNSLISQSYVHAFAEELRSYQQRANIEQQRDQEKNEKLEKEILHIQSAQGK